MKKIRILLVTNALGPPTRGNGTTVMRWLAYGPEYDIDFVPILPDAVPPDGPFDLVHGYHAIHGGVTACEIARETGLPLVISLGGTDLLALREPRPMTNQARRVIGGARAIVGACESFREVLQEELDAGDRYHLAVRSVSVPDVLVTRARSDHLRVALPAGLRPVKDPMLALDLFEGLQARGVRIRLRILGPVLDETYGARVLSRINTLEDVTVGEVDREEMARVYNEAHVVWNTSRHEGGANALLEALAHGCQVYARDVPGNRDLLANQWPDALFDPTAEDWIDQAAERHARLQSMMPVRVRAVAERQRTWVREHHDISREMAGLRAAYESVVT